MRHKSVTQETEDILHKLQDYIREEPRRFDLGLWGGVVDPNSFDDPEFLANEEYRSPEAYDFLKRQRPPCGAVGCIAGNVLIMTGKIKPKEHFNGIRVYGFDYNTPYHAQRVLRLSNEQAARLFYLKSWGRVTGWPNEFEEELKQYDPGTKEYVDVTCRRIDHFIETGE